MSHVLMFQTKMEVAAGDQERKYVQLGPDSIVLAGESVGLTNLPGTVTRALAEDVSYRTREVASLAALFLKHGRKRKLSVEDMNYALKWSDVEQVVGEGGSQEVSVSQLYKFVPECDLFVEADHEVDLVGDLSQDSKPTTEEEPRLSITASWLHVEGGDSPALSPALQQYYRAVVTHTLGDSEELCVTILRDIASNGKIAPLLPYLITFIRQAMKRFPVKSLLQTRMLRLISAIFSNPQLNLSPKPYLSHLVTALLTTVLCQDVSSVDHVTLASTILSLALSRWATPVNQLKCQTLKHLKDFVTSERGQGWAQYGALSCLILLGPELVTDTLTPWPPQLWTHLETLSSQQTEVSCLQWAAIRRAGACIINHWIEGSGSDQNWSLYQDLYQNFSDSLVPQIKLIEPGHCSNIPPPSRKVIRYSDTFGRIKFRKFSSNSKRKASQVQSEDPGGSNIEPILTASQNFDILADMGVPSDIFEPGNVLIEFTNSSNLPDIQCPSWEGVRLCLVCWRVSPVRVVR